MGNKEGRHSKLKTLVEDREVDKLLKVSCGEVALVAVTGTTSWGWSFPIGESYLSIPMSKDDF